MNCQEFAVKCPDLPSKGAFMVEHKNYAEDIMAENPSYPVIQRIF